MLVASLSSSVTNAVGNHGLIAIFFLLVVAAVLPVASELVMLYAGAVAGGAFAGVTLQLFGHDIQSHLWAYVAVAVAGTLGNVVGAAGGWWIGARGGRAFVHRYGRYIHVSEAKLDRAEHWFERYDDWAVPFGFALPLVRSFVAIPAGIVEVPFRKFIVLALIGCSVFCFGLAAAGWALGSAYTHAHHALTYVEYALVAGIVAAAAYFIYRWATLNRRRASDTPD
jgi:membrane protein DedA with SNARE-associated domain